MSSTGSIATLPTVPGLRDVAGFREALAGIDGDSLSDAERVDLLEGLERLKSAAAAAQATVTAAFAASQVAMAPRKDADRFARSVAAQVALARHDSPARGQQHLGLARALREMPCTRAALARGDISEWRAVLMMRETSVLSVEDRARVDAELAPRLASLGDRRLGDAVRGIAQRLDPGAAVRRARRAESERRISLRPAPDTMSHLSGLLPVAQGVAAYAALRREAESLRGQGDPRTISQLMADLLVARVTGRELGPAQDAGTVPAVEIQLVMSERTLLRGGHEPAQVPGFGPVPAILARQLARAADKVWLRRLFTRPGAGDLVAMDSRRRLFTGRLRDLLIARDQICRTPWCDAPVRHADHITPHADSGPTELDNGQGLCEACNYAKQAPGWRADVIHLPGPHTVETTTPTGHRYRSSAPPPPGAPPDLTTRLRDWLGDHLDDTG